MKLFTKIAAAAMAAVMSMALLTGCSGGGGGSVTSGGVGGTVAGSTMKKTVIEENGEPYSGYYSEYTTTNGKWMYIEMVQGMADGMKTDINLSNKEGDVYYIKNGKAYKEPGQHPWGTGTTAKQTYGKWEYKGKTYQTVETSTITDGKKMTEKWCYDGNWSEASLKYIVDESEKTTWVWRVDEFSTKPNEEKLDINNYTIVQNYEDLYK